MSKYHKIQTVYLRDPETKFKTLLEGQFARPEFEIIDDWIWEEKIDGTNIRVIWNGQTVEFRGRTDRAQLPEPLLKWMIEKFPVPLMTVLFGASPTVIYGEGCGAKIQKGGGNYYPDQRLVMFDVSIDGYWLERKNVEDVAQKLDLVKAPVLHECDIKEAVRISREGFSSEWGEFQAEGLVGRPRYELMDRFGRRIITKIKCKDFR